VNQQGVSGETARVRSFTYDSLSHLLSATNRETGAIGYSYDVNGNVKTKTDARGITTSYGFDGLDRLTSKSYSDGMTAKVLYVYDTNNITFSSTQKFTTSNVIGRLSVICVDIPGACQSMTAYSYDLLGRTNQALSITPSNPTTGAVYAVSATYDLAGNPTSVTYPDGRVVAQGLDSASHLQSLTYASWNGQPVGYTYISSSAYWPSGILRAYLYGNSVASGYAVNNRLQTDETSHLNLTTNARYYEKLHCFGVSTPPIDSISPPCDSLTSGNNGNVLQIKDIVNSANLQTFGYDSNNRITSASLPGLSQQYAHDSFGNMTMVTGGAAVSTFDPATNRISNLPCTSVLTPYDAAGNQLCDVDQNGARRQYKMDAENRITQISIFGNATPFEKYLYDADGTRVSKSGANGSLTEYINFNGLQLAERNSAGSWSDLRQRAEDRPVRYCDCTLEWLGQYHVLSFRSTRLNRGLDERQWSAPLVQSVPTFRSGDSLGYKYESLQVHGQRERLRIRTRLLRGQILRKHDGQVDVTRLG
jgi:YD repeat-containing protein